MFDDHFSYPYLNVITCSMLLLRLKATGQLWAVYSIKVLYSVEWFFGKWKLHTILLILLGFDCMTFYTSHVAFPISRFLAFPRIAMVVKAHWAKEVAHKSVGENFYPFPWLSVGASLSIFVLLCKCIAWHLKSPTYFILAVILEVA